LRREAVRSLGALGESDSLGALIADAHQPSEGRTQALAEIESGSERPPVAYLRALADAGPDEVAVAARAALAAREREAAEAPPASSAVATTTGGSPPAARRAPSRGVAVQPGA